uniref:Uncharacterized protein n=1 Tax=Caenorhabditis japonica TaxID=281687 RepID=A0A8R1IKN7_CAEJA
MPQPSAHHLPPPLPAPRHHPPENRRPESDRPPSTLPTLAAQPPPPRNTDKMLKTGGFYCPINREPLSYREEARIGMQKPTTTTTPGGSVGRHNEITVSIFHFLPSPTEPTTRLGGALFVG